MNRFFCLFLAAAAAASLTACSGPETDGNYGAAQAGETYTGTVTEISLEHIMISTENGEVQIPYTDDTEFSGFGGMGGGFRRPDGGGNPADMGENANTGEEGISDLESPPDQPGGADPPSGQDSGNTIQDIVGTQPQSSSFEDVSLNDEVTVAVGDDGAAETITLTEAAVQDETRQG